MQRLRRPAAGAPGSVVRSANRQIAADEEDHTMSASLNSGKGGMPAFVDALALLSTLANRDPAIFGDHPDAFDLNRARPAGQMPWGLTFGSGRHMCFGSNLVIGVAGKADAKMGTDGTLVKIAKLLFDHGCRLDPDNRPVAATQTYIDAFDRVPVVFDRL